MTGGSGVNHMECDFIEMPTAWAKVRDGLFFFPGLFDKLGRLWL